MSWVSETRDIAAARTFFTRAIRDHERPRQVTTDLAAPLLRVVDDLLPDFEHDTSHHANNRAESDHSRLKARLGPMRGLKTDQTASIVIRGTP